VFLSRALTDRELQTVAAAAAGRPEVRLVFRGPRPGERLDAAIRGWQALLRGLDPPPTLELDPPAFQAAGVSVVPLLRLEENGREIARVRGTLALEWFEREVAAGRRGDLGAYGPVVALLEPDLLAVMRQRAGALDWEHVKAQAAARYWRQVAFTELPEATAERRYRVDLTVTVGRDLRAPDGRWIAHAGDRFDPLQVRPLRTRLLVFDPTRPAQRALAHRLLAEAGDRPLRLLATRLEREAGWADLAALEQDLAAPVYLLTPAVQDRFRLERVPVLVEAEGGELWVRELRP
jgi:conjugal transfer pilus assembly protein TraW